MHRALQGPGRDWHEGKLKSSSEPAKSTAQVQPWVLSRPRDTARQEGHQAFCMPVSHRALQRPCGSQSFGSQSGSGWSRAEVLVPMGAVGSLANSRQ
jgi:hypothetical protein